MFRNGNRAEPATIASVEYASIAARILAHVLDGLLAAGLGFFLFSGALAFLPKFAFLRGVSVTGDFHGDGILLVFLSFLAPVSLWGVVEGATGYSPGKRLLKIKVVRTDLTPCGLWRGILRNVFKLVEVYWMGIIAIVSVTITERRQRIGDLVAGTVVVNASSLSGN